MESKKKTALKTVIIIIAAAAAICLLVFFSRSDEYTDSFIAMDTYCSVKLSGKDAEEAAKEFKEITEKLDSETLSRFEKGSLVYSLNENSEENIPESLAKYFDTLFDVYRQSEGAYDFTLGAVSDLWAIGTDNERVPGSDEIKAATGLCGADKLIYDGSSMTVPGGMKLDLGSAGKGIALDEIKAKSDSLNLKKCVVSLGGSVLVCGKGNFKVGIQKPGAAGYIAVINTDGAFISTSGSYERYFEKDGVRYHHILDPDTGYPAESGIVSATIIAQSGTLSDALSTACFVLGAEKGAELCLEYGCEGVFVSADNKIYATPGAAEMLEITDSSYSLEVIR